MAKRANVADIERLRALRVRPPRDLTITPQLQALVRSVRSTQRTTSVTGAQWQRLVPERLRGGCVGVRVVRGSVVVEVHNSTVMHQMVQWLKGGGEAALLLQVGGVGVSRVRVRVARG